MDGKALRDELRDERWARRLAPLTGRRLTAIFDLTNRCNLRCRQCYFSFDSVFHQRPEFLSAADFEQVARQVLPLAHTAYLSAATEPLASPDFVPILGIAARFAPLQIKLITNAILLQRRTAEALVEHGVSEVHISIDGGTRETYEHFRRGARFETFLTNVAMLDDVKRARNTSAPLLQFNVTLMRRNLDELDSIVDLAARHGVARIAARHLILYEGLGMEQESLTLDPLRANERLHAMQERARREGIGIVNFPDFFPIGGRPWAPPAAPPCTGATRAEDAPSGSEEFAEGPLGNWDGPLEYATESDGQLSFHGWALDASGPVEVELCRDPFPKRRAWHRDRRRPVRIGKASFQNGTRPDVVQRFPGIDAASRAGWTFVGRVDDPAWKEESEMVVRAIARNAAGQCREIGRRSIRRCGPDVAPPWLYCHYPFDSIFIGPDGKVFPYPDCQGIDPYGRLQGETRLEELWFGEVATDLRRRIIRRDPPEMCRRCAIFINRNVADDFLFRARPVEERYRAPRGAIDAPGDGARSPGRSIALEGWADGFSAVVRVEVQRRRTEQDPEDSRAADSEGFLPLGTAAFEPGAPPRGAHGRLPRRADSCPRWKFLLERGELPGAGGFEFRAVAVNRDGDRRVLGSRTIWFD